MQNKSFSQWRDCIHPVITQMLIDYLLISLALWLNLFWQMLTMVTQMPTLDVGGDNYGNASEFSIKCDNSMVNEHSITSSTKRCQFHQDLNPPPGVKKGVDQNTNRIVQSWWFRTTVASSHSVWCLYRHGACVWCQSSTPFHLLIPNVCNNKILYLAMTNFQVNQRNHQLYNISMKFIWVR